MSYDFLLNYTRYGTLFIIDPLKTRYKVIGPIWIDQLLHILTILLILSLKI